MKTQNVLLASLIVVVNSSTVQASGRDLDDVQAMIDSEYDPVDSSLGFISAGPPVGRSLTDIQAMIDSEYEPVPVSVRVDLAAMEIGGSHIKSATTSGRSLEDILSFTTSD